MAGETPETTDLPEPDDVLSGEDRNPDHEPGDDDREIPLDDPEEPEPPIDEEAHPTP